MKCPICKREVEDMKYRPFCSKRCADIDLGNWFNEKYTIPAVEIDDADLKQLETEVLSEDENCGC